MFALSACVIATALSALILPVASQVKPGRCPSTAGLGGTCSEACSSDEGCPGELKCCYNGCGHSCLQPTQACALFCFPRNEPVCGTDGVTYRNLCQLQQTACLRNRNISVQHDGRCSNVICRVACTTEYNPVCGTDGVTYGNRCQLNATACLKNATILVQHDGECINVACRVACTREYNPVCGTDGVTYGNRCVLNATACLKNATILVQHDGECINASAPSCVQTPLCVAGTVWNPMLCKCVINPCLLARCAGRCTVVTSACPSPPCTPVAVCIPPTSTHTPTPASSCPRRACASIIKCFYGLKYDKNCCPLCLCNEYPCSYHCPVNQYCVPVANSNATHCDPPFKPSCIFLPGK